MLTVDCTNSVQVLSGELDCRVTRSAEIKVKKLVAHSMYRESFHTILERWIVVGVEARDC